MQLLEEKKIPGVSHGGSPGLKAAEIFSDYDFGTVDVIDSDGADSVVHPGSPHAESTIRFYVEPADGQGDSVPMLFRVEFSPIGAHVKVYG
jgi:hypothetical protein